MLKSLIYISAAMLMLSGGTVAAAKDGVVYVMRPPIPGKAAGVLSPKAFVLTPTNPGNPGGSGEGEQPTSEYDFKSSLFDQFGQYPIVEAPLKMRPYPEQDDYLIIQAPSFARKMVCHFTDQYGTPTQPYISSGRFLYQSNNIGGIMVRPISPGKFAVTMECQSQDIQNNPTGYFHNQRYVITVSN